MFKGSVQEARKGGPRGLHRIPDMGFRIAGTLFGLMI
jgi:hypothetical protein